MTRLLFIFIILMCFVGSACAAFTPEFSSNESAHYNVSYANAPANATPMEMPMFFAVLGIALLIGSFMVSTSQGSDVIALMSPLPLLISAWQFLHVDVVTGYGTTIAEYTGLPTVSTMMESHMIYQMYPQALILFIFFLISLLNLYRVIMSPKYEKDPDLGD